MQAAGKQYWLVSAYDVTNLFRAREEKFRELFRLELAALALAGTAAALAVSWMIRPLKSWKRPAGRGGGGLYFPPPPKAGMRWARSAAALMP